MKNNTHQHSEIGKKVFRTTSGPITRPTLLKGLKDEANQKAWNRFFQLYSALILGFSRSRGCSHEMAKEVLQETMICLLTELPKFEYNPKRGHFRSYLLSIVNYRIRRAFQRQKYFLDRHDSLEEMNNRGIGMNSFPADTNDDQPGREWDDLWTKNLAMQALHQLGKRISSHLSQMYFCNVEE